MGNQSPNSKNDGQYKGKKPNDNQWSTKQSTENPEGKTVSAPLVASVVLLLFIKNIG